MIEDREREVVRSLDDSVAKHIHILQEIDQRRWWPHTFFDFLNDNPTEGLLELQERARALPEDVLISLIGNTITEEALPNYASRLANLFPDPTGTSQDPWHVWQRGWNAEEDTHGRVLETYLRLTGRVNMGAVEKTIFGLISAGMQHAPSLYEGILYPTFQEPATRVTHVNTGRLAQKQGDETLGTICKLIAGDEARHGRFYMAVSNALLDEDPEGGIISLHSMLRQGIIMPARYMTDGEVQAPDLYNNFAAVTQSIGVYTANDYVDVFEHVLSGLDVEHRSVSGEAAKAQERLMRMPALLRRVGEKRATEPREPFGFSWLYGHKA